MPVSSTSRKAGPFLGNGVTTSFPFTFKVFSTSDVAIYHTDAAGVQTLLASGYTVAINADQDTSPGGSVTYPSAGAPMPVGESLDVIGAQAYLQGADIRNGGTFQPSVVQRALDYLAILAQQLFERSSRTLTFRPGDTGATTLAAADDRAGKVFTWDENGDPSLSVDNFADMVAAASASESAAAGSASAAASSERAAAAIVVGNFIQNGTGGVSVPITTEMRAASLRLDQFNTTDNARAQQKAVSILNFYDVTIGGVTYRVDSRGFYEHQKDLAAVAGRHSLSTLRTTWKGDGLFSPGASGAAASTNASAIALSQLHYGGGNSEPIQSLSRSFGSAAQGGIIQDLAAYAGTGQYGGEWVLRDGEVVPSTTISAKAATTVTLAASATTQYFGAGINTRTAVKRGRPLLNDTRKIALAAATLSGYQVTVASTTGIVAGDYFGFDADTQAVSIGTARHLSRIASVDDATHFTLDNVYEAAGYTAAYQGASVNGAAAVFPATLPSSYDPDTRVFSFNAALGSLIDARFQVGDTVVQYPATDFTSIGLQIDLNCRIVQKAPRDIGFVAVGLGRQALAAFYCIGDSALAPYAFKYGAYLQNVSVGRFFSGFPQNETDNCNGLKNWHRNQAPSIIAADGLKGSIYQRQNGGIDKSLYVKIVDTTTQGWAPVQNLQEGGWFAASMPAVTTEGFRAWCNELDMSVEWSVSSNRWQNGGYRAIGTAAQKPAGIWPGFRYYETDTPSLKTWNGAAWV